MAGWLGLQTRPIYHHIINQAETTGQGPTNLCCVFLLGLAADYSLITCSLQDSETRFCLFVSGGGLQQFMVGLHLVPACKTSVFRLQIQT